MSSQPPVKSATLPSFPELFVDFSQECNDSMGIDTNCFHYGEDELDTGFDLRITGTRVVLYSDRFAICSSSDGSVSECVAGRDRSVMFLDEQYRWDFGPTTNRTLRRLDQIEFDQVSRHTISFKPTSIDQNSSFVLTYGPNIYATVTSWEAAPVQDGIQVFVDAHAMQQDLLSQSSPSGSSIVSGVSCQDIQDETGEASLKIAGDNFSILLAQAADFPAIPVHVDDRLILLEAVPSFSGLFSGSLSGSKSLSTQISTHQLKLSCPLNPGLGAILGFGYQPPAARFATMGDLPGVPGPFPSSSNTSFSQPSSTSTSTNSAGLSLSLHRVSILAITGAVVAGTICLAGLIVAAVCLTRRRQRGGASRAATPYRGAPTVFTYEKTYATMNAARRPSLPDTLRAAFAAGSAAALMRVGARNPYTVLSQSSPIRSSLDAVTSSQETDSLSRRSMAKDGFYKDPTSASRGTTSTGLGSASSFSSPSPALAQTRSPAGTIRLVLQGYSGRDPQVRDLVRQINDRVEDLSHPPPVYSPT